MDSDSEPEFVRHVALSAAAVDGYQSPAPLQVAHMGPPLNVSDTCTFHAVGSVPLSDEERNQIRLFVSDIDSERRAEIDRLQARRRAGQNERAREYVENLQYCVRPYTRSVTRSVRGGVVQLRQFSCAGFVIAAYQDAGIELIVTDEAQLPEVTLADLLKAYPDRAEILNDPSQRNRDGLNLAGDGPWPVVMAGYILNALASINFVSKDPRCQLPYRPQSGDEYFPPRRATPNSDQSTPERQQN